MKRHVLGHIRILMLDSSSVFVRLWHTIFFLSLLHHDKIVSFDYL